MRATSDTTTSTLINALIMLICFDANDFLCLVLIRKGIQNLIEFLMMPCYVYACLVCDVSNAKNSASFHGFDPPPLIHN